MEFFTKLDWASWFVPVMFCLPNGEGKILIHEFHPMARGKGGVFCDEGGAFVGQRFPKIRRQNLSLRDNP